MREVRPKGVTKGPNRGKMVVLLASRAENKPWHSCNYNRLGTRRLILLNIISKLLSSPEAPTYNFTKQDETQNPNI